MVHGCMAYTECAKTAKVSCGTSHVSAVSTPLRWIFKNAPWKASRSCKITYCESSESARERRYNAIYKSDRQQQVSSRCWMEHPFCVTFTKANNFSTNLRHVQKRQQKTDCVGKRPGNVTQHVPCRRCWGLKLLMENYTVFFGDGKLSDGDGHFWSWWPKTFNWWLKVIQLAMKRSWVLDLSLIHISEPTRPP